MAEVEITKRTAQRSQVQILSPLQNSGPGISRFPGLKVFEN